MLLPSPAFTNFAKPELRQHVLHCGQGDKPNCPDRYAHRHTHTTDCPTWTTVELYCLPGQLQVVGGSVYIPGQLVVVRGLFAVVCRALNEHNDNDHDSQTDDAADRDQARPCSRLLAVLCHTHTHTHTCARCVLFSVNNLPKVVAWSPR